MSQPNPTKAYDHHLLHSNSNALTLGDEPGVANRNKHQVGATASAVKRGRAASGAPAAN